ncbi:MAG TPA: branched-chain amino acid ABC transporter permease [Streptosporangiaceae bacterium]|nr:branched-chain amino acid ABC transporter permease [Streptosporangiaceae bacterium]
MSARGGALRRARSGGLWAGFFAALLALPVVLNAHWLLNIAVFTLMFAVLATAWNLVGGYAGYPSLGHGALFGIGAYAEALLFAGRDVGAGYGPFLAAAPIGVAVALAALPVAWIAMRTRAEVFAIVTITLLFITQALAFNLRGLTGGAQGIALPVPPFAERTFEWPYYYALLALLAVALGAAFAVDRTKLGSALLAIRADEDKARGVGVHVTFVKLLAFGLSAAFTAAAGAIWAYYVSFVYPQFAIDPFIAIAMVLMTYLGGRATLWGPVLGAFLLAPAQQLLAYQFGSSRLYLVAYAAVFLVVILALPRGIVPTLAAARQPGPAYHVSVDRVRARRERIGS